MCTPISLIGTPVEQFKDYTAIYEVKIIKKLSEIFSECKVLVPYKFHEDIPANQKFYVCNTPELRFPPNFGAQSGGCLLPVYTSAYHIRQI